MDTKQMIEVMQAHMEGKAIESRAKNTETWSSATSPSWDWFTREYRIKKEPVVIYAVPFSGGRWEGNNNRELLSKQGFLGMKKFVEVIEEK